MRPRYHRLASASDILRTSVTFELPELKTEDALENTMTLLDLCFKVLKGSTNGVIVVNVDPKLDSFETGEELWDGVH